MNIEICWKDRLDGWILTTLDANDFGYLSIDGWMVYGTTPHPDEDQPYTEIGQEW